MMTAFLGSLLLAYSSMLALCQGLERHYKQVWGRVPTLLQRRVLRGGGWLLLVASLWGCAQAWGWAMGPVGWFGMLSLSGFALALLLPYAPRLAVYAPVLGLPCWLLLYALAG